MRLFRIVCVLILCLAPVLRADEQIDRIYNDFSEGRFSRAESRFRELPPTTVRDGNRLFISALFEAGGPRVRELLEAALQTDLDGKYREEAVYRLVRLAEAEGDTAAVLSKGQEFLDRWETSRYREQVLSMLAAHAPDRSSSQKRYLQLLVDEMPGSYGGQYARLVQAHEAFGRQDYATAERLCRRINNVADDELTAASLILLSRIALAKNDAERALLNYNILNEQFRHAIDQEDLVLELRRISESRSGQESTEVFEGITYSVQVGVFAEKDNARTMAKRIEGYGLETRISKRTISGSVYHVVLAGDFATLKEAETAKQKLETGEHEIFKVVINDEK